MWRQKPWIDPDEGRSARCGGCDPAFAEDDGEDQAEPVLGVCVQYRTHPDSRRAALHRLRSPAESHFRRAGDGALVRYGRVKLSDAPPVQAQVLELSNRKRRNRRTRAVLDSQGQAHEQKFFHPIPGQILQVKILDHPDAALGDEVLVDCVSASGGDQFGSYQILEPPQDGYYWTLQPYEQEQAGEQE